MRSEDWSTSSTFDSELCAVMEECNKALDSSRALTLRSKSESKNVSDCDARPRYGVFRFDVTRAKRLLRGERDGDSGEQSSVSSSASSALSG